MKRLLLYIICALASGTALAQKNEAYLRYIETYKYMAIDQMQRHRIPASITLAQGIIESNAGRSMLATEANNHFGIKVGTSWTGPYVTKNDDAVGEQFRKYDSVEESYEDHSIFLQRQRYASLFNLAPTDYEGWAYGLKAAGYATNPQYPALLIGVIEYYDLAQYDHQHIDYAQTLDNHVTKTTVATTPKSKHVITHLPKLCNDVAYVVARKGDTYELIAYETGIKASKLRKYNEVGPCADLKEGDLVYLAKKKDHVARPIRHAFHRIEVGESVHSISQRYGIRMKNIYKWNNLPASYRPSPDELLLME